MSLEKRTHYHVLLREKLDPVAGALALMQQLSEQHIQIALASTSILETVQLTLELLGLRERIAVMVTAEAVHHSKPHPEIYQLTCAKIGFPPNQCLAFEDSPQGIGAAVAAGVPVVAVAGDYPPIEVAVLATAGCIETFTEVEVVTLA